MDEPNEENNLNCFPITIGDMGLVPDQVNDVETGKSFGCGRPPVELGSLLQSFTPSMSPLVEVELRLRIGGSFPATGCQTTIQIRSQAFDGIVFGSAITSVPSPQKTGAEE